MSIVYKILRPAEWRAFEASGRFEGAPIDRADGYIHLSAADQTAETMARYFADEAAPVILACDAAAMGAQLRWEASRDGALFPHFYGVLERAHVLHAAPAPRGTDGVHMLPEFVR
jgi:uncharacterized protein (DUF952 family)